MKGVIAPGWWELVCGACKIGEGGVRHATRPRSHGKDPPGCRVTVLTHEQFTTRYHHAANAKAGVWQQRDRYTVNTERDRRCLQIVRNLRMRFWR